MPGRKSLIIIYAILLLFIPNTTDSQFYSAGQDPFSTDWQQIRTENFQIIFPAEFAHKASYLADFFESIYYIGSNSLDHNPRKISVILHNQTVISNGFVSWAPRRIEMYSNPPQTNDVYGWLEGLAIHEYRHVVQVDKLNQGITRLGYYLFGEQAIGAVLGLFVPRWFLEGDAVAIETAITYGGRGRLPSFEKGLRAQVLEKEKYHFEKAVLGSYKDHVPNHYELGYQLVAAARVMSGEHVWANVLDNVAKKPYSLIPFSRGIKNNTGYNRNQLYYKTIEYLDSAWQHQYDKKQYSEKDFINTKQKFYTNYNHVQFIDDETFLALKTGMDDIPKVVILKKDGSEKVLFTPGWYLPNSFSYSSGLVAWSEYQHDLRWEHRNWSNIHTYNIETGKRERLTENARLFAPALSPDARSIAAVKTTEKYEFFLVIIDAETGQEAFSTSINNNDFLLTPTWHSSGNKIAFIAQNQKGKRIVELDLETNEIADLWNSGFTEISNPVYYYDNIVFSGSFSGIDDLYLYDRDNGEVRRIVSAEFGAYQPAVSACNNYIAYSDYNSNGYQAAIISVKNSDNKELNKIENNSVGFYQTLAGQENNVVCPGDIERTDHEIKKYHRLPNLFNPHSWGLAYIDATNYEINPGAAIQFQDMLSTSFATIGYEYNVNDEQGTWKINYSYKGFYPVIDFVAETGTRESYYRHDDTLASFLWQRNHMGIGLRLPLSFTRYEYYYKFEPLVRKAWDNAIMKSSATEILTDNHISQMQYRLTFSRTKRMSSRDIFPRYAQYIGFNYRHMPFNNDQTGHIFSSRLILYVPGFFDHHSIRISAAYQERTDTLLIPNTITFRYPNLINYPRSITGQLHNKIRSYSADYTLPLFYPDFRIPYILYIKRIWGTIFYDHAIGTLNNKTDYFNVAGVNINTDTHLFRFSYPFTIGGQFSYNLKTEKVHFNMLFNIHF